MEYSSIIFFVSWDRGYDPLDTVSIAYPYKCNSYHFTICPTNYYRLFEFLPVFCLVGWNCVQRIKDNLPC